jgi:hypothetical protein
MFPSPVGSNSKKREGKKFKFEKSERYIYMYVSFYRLKIASLPLLSVSTGLILFITQVISKYNKRN